jgi:uncharacterized protein (TIGR02466 family)
MNIIPLFAQPVCTSTYECGDDFRNWLNSQPMKSTIYSSEYGDVSEDTYILDQPECSNLKKVILEHANNFYKDILAKNVAELEITQSWISHKNPNQYHVQHLHPNSVISGVYYYEYEQNCALPAIRFHKEIIGGVPEIRVAIDNQKVPNCPFAWDWFDFTPSQGTLILFPSYLKHSVPINTSGKIRKSLAFNTIPRGKVGEEHSLTELLFGRVN